MTNQFHRWALDSLTAKQLCISRILQDFQDFCSGNVMAGFQDAHSLLSADLAFFSESSHHYSTLFVPPHCALSGCHVAGCMHASALLQSVFLSALVGHNGLSIVR